MPKPRATLASLTAPDTRIRILVPWLMARLRCDRAAAILWLREQGPEGYRTLYRLAALERLAQCARKRNQRRRAQLLEAVA